MFKNKEGQFDIDKMFNMLKTAATTFGLDLEKEAPEKMAEAIAAIREREKELGGRLAYCLVPLDDNSGFMLMTFVHKAGEAAGQPIAQTPIKSIDGIIDLIKLFVNGSPATSSLDSSNATTAISTNATN